MKQPGTLLGGVFNAGLFVARAMVVWCIWLGAAVDCVAQPANDNFTNRIQLSGTVVTFSGSTAGATHEASFEPLPYPVQEPTIWWTWTAPETSAVMIEQLNAPYPPQSTLEGLGVYSETNYLQPEGWTALAEIRFSRLGPFTKFQAQAGQSYQIALAALNTNTFVFRLTATNAPIFRVEPTNTTAALNASALLTSAAIASDRPSYQWQCNGTDLANATNQMLAFDHVAFSNAGDYRVIATSNTGDRSTSAVARLDVIRDPVEFRALGIVDGTNFQFRVSGDVGRNYHLDSSTNLSDWPITARTSLSNPGPTTVFGVAADTPLSSSD